MRKYGFRAFVMIFVSAVLMLIGGVSLAQDGGMSTEAIKNAYRQILAGADKNGDGRISMQECRAMSSAKEMEKNCKYWDANGDGFITQEEYVQQVKKLGNVKRPPPPT
jgi:Ca2+-binding EF-hand superfamily protein